MQDDEELADEAEEVDSVLVLEADQKNKERVINLQEPG